MGRKLNGFGDSFRARRAGDTTSKLNHVYDLKVKRLRFAFETTFCVTLVRDFFQKHPHCTDIFFTFLINAYLACVRFLGRSGFMSVYPGYH